jgi:hypothetical protein
MKKTTLLLVLLVSALMGYAQDVLDIAPAQVSEVEGFNPAASHIIEEAHYIVNLYIHDDFVF